MTTATTGSCALCDDPLASATPLECLGCGAEYHRACRLAFGRCLTAGCTRAVGLERRGRRDGSNLDVDVGPYLWAGLWAVPLAGGLGSLFPADARPVVGLLLLFVFTAVLGNVRARWA